MPYEYSIHPAIGIARAGNSPTEFYLEPVAIGGLPLRCDEGGNAVLGADGRPLPVEEFKDAAGQVKRQAARFAVYRREREQPGSAWQEVTLGQAGVQRLAWSAHVANKKAVWYSFSELEGDLMFGPENSYQARGVPLTNPTPTDRPGRQKWIIDPGPRRVDQPGSRQPFSRDTVPPDYPFGSFPDPQNVTQGNVIDTLGEILMDRDGRLLVLGGHGLAGGAEPIASFGGAATWHDDISDGPVSCTLTLEGEEPIELAAWLIVGSPKFAPELVNMVSLDDIAFDVGVRYLGLLPALFHDGAFDPGYVADYERDIAPILTRPVDNIWVANVPSMAAFSYPRFDTRDSSAANRPNREAYFHHFRREDMHDELTADPAGNGLPLMPLNSGSNSVSNTLTDKFLTLTRTQYFLLGQWAAGQFTSAAGRGQELAAVHPLDRASLGNCVGGPMCPGIEVTWSTRNPAIYQRPFVILPRHDEAYYRQNGLDPFADECAGGGCEPGDLTKRMAVPWQADFFQCTVQFINYTVPNENQDPTTTIPIPPTYYAYWWPPQSPMYVLSGVTTIDEQAAAGVPAGFQVYYPRGVNSFAQMITAWSYLGFVLNETAGPDRQRYPYFVEKERNHEQFQVVSAAVGDIGNFDNPTDTTFFPFWFLKPEPAPTHPTLMAAMALPGVPSTVQRPVRAPVRGNRHHGRV